MFICESCESNEPNSHEVGLSLPPPEEKIKKNAEDYRKVHHSFCSMDCLNKFLMALVPA